MNVSLGTVRFLSLSLSLTHARTRISVSLMAVGCFFHQYKHFGPNIFPRE